MSFREVIRNPMVRNFRQIARRNGRKERFRLSGTFSPGREIRLRGFGHRQTQFLDPCAIRLDGREREMASRE